MTLLLIGGRESAEERPGVGRYMAGGRRYPFQGFRETAFQRFWEFTVGSLSGAGDVGVSGEVRVCGVWLLEALASLAEGGVGTK